MQHKMSLAEFSQEAKSEQDQFDAVEQSFAQDASLAKLNRGKYFIESQKKVYSIDWL